MLSKKPTAPRAKPLVDRFGVIREAHKALPRELQTAFLAALAELEDNEAHRTFRFPHTQLHKVVGVKQAIYRAYIDKITGWRLHLQYAKNDELHLKDVLEPGKHDRVGDSIKAKQDRHE